MKPLQFLFFLFVFAPFQNIQAFWGNKSHEGEALYKNKDYDAALKKLLDAQINQPENMGLKYNLANTYYKLGKYQEAEKLFQTVAHSARKNLSQKSFYNLGNTSYRMGKLQESIAHYEKALELNPRDQDAQFNLEFVRKEIKRRLEEEKKRQEDQKNRPQGDQEQENQKNQNDQANQGQNSPQAGQEKKPQEDQNQQAASGGQGNQQDKKEGEALSQDGQDENKKAMSKEEAARWLDTVKEGRENYLKRRMQGQKRYQTEKDW